LASDAVERFRDIEPRKKEAVAARALQSEKLSPQLSRCQFDWQFQAMIGVARHAIYSHLIETALLVM